MDVRDYLGAGGTIFLANPNAPTGLALSLAQIEEILKANSDNVVVIDEAYVDFGAESAAGLIHRYDNLLVTQTFSKSRSLAGGRLGFGLGCKALIRDLNTIKYSTNPYNINSMTMAAGIGALRDEDYFQSCCRSIQENRAWTAAALEALGFTVLPSKANFLFARHGRFDLNLLCRGDVEVDFHHTTEDVGIVLGTAFAEVLGDKRGIERYGGKIKILCGIEQDFYSEEPTEGYDYVIGSVHYLRTGGEYIPVDESPELLRAAAEKYFRGDFYALIEEYYRTLARVVEKTGADIIGHFDLIAKFNEGGALFDETDPRYLAAAQKAADILLKTGRPFEINTGAISRGYRTSPYPSLALRDYIRQKGGSFVISSDSHAKETLCFGFDTLEK